MRSTQIVGKILKMFLKPVWEGKMHGVETFARISLQNAWLILF